MCSELLPLKWGIHLLANYFQVIHFFCCILYKAALLKHLYAPCCVYNNVPLRNIYSTLVAHGGPCQNSANEYLRPVPAMREVYKTGRILHHNPEDKAHQD